MKITYNDKVIVPCTTPINCRQCVLNKNYFCIALDFNTDVRLQVFKFRCKGFKYEDSI